MTYKQDQHGNVVALPDSGGNILERYSYDAFGKPKVTGFWDDNDRGGSWYGNRFMFTGREWIAELGIYDYRNRYYQPQLGRFLQSDPTGFGAGDMNLFRYCGDDPVDGSDPTGLIMVDVTWSKQMWMQGGSQRSFNAILEKYRDHPAGVGDGGGGDSGAGGGKSISKENEGAKSGNSKDSSGQRAPSWIRRSATSYFVPFRGKNGQTLYRAHTVWTVTLLDEHTQPTFGQGIRVDEKVDRYNPVSYAGSGEETAGGPTRPGGWVEDHWKLAFSSLDGKITTQQSFFVGGREAKLTATTNARGEVEDGSQYLAPFR